MELKDFEEFLVNKFDQLKKVRFLYRFPNNFGLAVDIPKDDLLDLECTAGYWKNKKWFKNDGKMPFEMIWFIEEDYESVKWLEMLKDLPPVDQYYSFLNKIDKNNYITPRSYKQAVIKKLKGDSVPYNMIVQSLIDKLQEEIDDYKLLIDHEIPIEE